MQSTISETKDMIIRCIKAQLVPLVTGSPGLGKTAAFQQIADDFNLFLIDVSLAQSDPTDINGYPSTTADGKKARYLPMETFPIEGDPIPEGYDGWLVFFDELTSAVPAVQAASYKLLLNRMVGVNKVHPRVVMGAAGNLEADNAVVEEMSTALQSRLIHIELTINNDEWLEWAFDNDIDERIRSFIRFKPGMLYTFKPDHTDRTYGCPRTWEFANRFIKQTKEVTRKDIPLLAGTLSEGVAHEFTLFCQIYDRLPKIEEILRNPETTPLSEEPSVLYALTGAVASNVKAENIEQLMKFIYRLPSEFQVFTLRDVLKLIPDLKSHPQIQKWIANTATELF